MHVNRNKKQNILTMKKAKSKNVDDKESKNKNRCNKFDLGGRDQDKDNKSGWVLGKAVGYVLQKYRKNNFDKIKHRQNKFNKLKYRQNNYKTPNKK
jgi:hypothetical protein